ncbi:PREDICTED: cuticle protein 16.5, isoform A-like [Papilio xuthus]|uniref:Cuticle protein 16.5, isoform A-like n=1 Tax=Papilio xuthus TaxID=66420 RepID=I4DIU4_PAPXU|nr:cuticle protein 16.5, isoform A-like precursor [Papilio xuthus]KPI97426.1 hypothetical protein RR46_09333 [Papilio xuthus]BAM17834.1 cuticular protein PxutCPH19 [Papilio xuthus]
MVAFKSIVLIAAAVILGAEASAPALAAPLVASAHVGYASAVPQNIPPYASQISVVNRAVSPYFAAPVAAPLAAPVAAPLAAPVAAPFAPAAYAAAPYALPAVSPYGVPAVSPYGVPAAYAAPYPYAAPLVRTAYGVAPAFVR